MKMFAVHNEKAFHHAQEEYSGVDQDKEMLIKWTLDFVFIFSVFLM